VKPDARTLADVDRTIHAPARLMIMTILQGAESADFRYLLNETGLTKGNLASHLAKLEERGYLELEKTYQGKVPLTLCRLTEEGRAAFEAYRQQLERIIRYTAPKKAST